MITPPKPPPPAWSSVGEPPPAPVGNAGAPYPAVGIGPWPPPPPPATSATGITSTPSRSRAAPKALRTDMFSPILLVSSHTSIVGQRPSGSGRPDHGVGPSPSSNGPSRRRRQVLGGVLGGHANSPSRRCPCEPASQRQPPRIGRAQTSRELERHRHPGARVRRQLGHVARANGRLPTAYSACGPLGSGPIPSSSSGQARSRVVKRRDCGDLGCGPLARRECGRLVMRSAGRRLVDCPERLTSTVQRPIIGLDGPWG